MIQKDLAFRKDNGLQVQALFYIHTLMQSSGNAGSYDIC